MFLRWIVSNWIRETAQRQVWQAAGAAATGAGAEETPAEPPPPCEVAVLFALGIEAGGLVDLLQGCRTTRCARLIEHVGMLGERRIVIAETGVGGEPARQAAEDLLQLHHPKWVISAGFAGALQPALRKGHILMASELASEAGQRLDLGIRQASDPQRPWLHQGRLLTVDRLIRSPDERQSLAEAHEAMACDMESWAIGQLCQRSGVPLMAVRIISDSVEDQLPDEIEALMNQKSLAGKLGAATGALFKRPSSVMDMWQLKEDAIKASDRLARFLSGIIAQLA